MMKKILVCGGRDYKDYKRISGVLSAIKRKYPRMVILHGDCRGADKLAARWAQENGINDVPFPAEWERGPRAGPERNQKMIEAKPDGVVAFGAGKGTADMLRRASNAGVQVMRYE